MLWNNTDESKPTSDTARAFRTTARKAGISYVLKGRRRTLPLRIAAAAAAVFIPAAIILWGYFRNADNSDGIVDEPVKMVEVSTAQGQRLQVFLPDSSDVWLNAESTVSYPEIFTGERREVILSRGEAFFSVTKDEGKPFSVDVKDMKVTVHGTQFNIDSYMDDGNITVELHGGSVAVRFEEPSTLAGLEYDLEPGQILTHNINDANVEVARFYPSANSWMNGDLIVKDKTFAGVIAALERHFDTSIEFDHDNCPEGLYSIKFVNRETLEEALAILEELTGGTGTPVKSSTERR